MSTNKTLQVAVAVALGTATTAAMAFNVGTTTPQYKVVMSGATASTNTVREFIIEDICDSTHAIDVYRSWDNVNNKFNKDWGVACHTKSTLDTSHSIAAHDVLFMKRDAGGSGFGVNPVLNDYAPTHSTGIDIMEFSDGAGKNCDPGVNPTTPKTTAAPNATAYTQHKCSGGLVTANWIPDGGFSDVEPDKFFGLNAPAGSYSDGHALGNYNASFSADVRATAGLVFGIPVTLNLRNALQAVQFPASSVCHPLNASYGANAKTLDCMPSLSGTEIRSVFVGGLHTWDDYYVDDPLGGAAKVSLASAVSGMGLSSLVPTDHKVQICRRVAGSGTQAQFQMVFLNRPCEANAANPLTEPGLIFTGPVVANNSSSGDVEKCLDDFNDGTNTSGKNAVTTKRWGIGLQSLEKNVGLSHAYRFIKVNGYAPTLQAVHAGDYEDYVESSMQWRTSGEFYNTKPGTTPNLATDVPSNASIKADTVTILDFIASSAVSPSVLATINGSYIHTFGESGWLAIPKPGVSPTNPFSSSNPVNTSTRAPLGSAPNSCQFPVAIKPVKVDTNVPVSSSEPAGNVM